jgi:DNA-damage-inducible protein J
MISFIYLCKNNITMGQTATTIRMDADLKAEFDKLCEEFGMSANTAFNIYVKTVVRQRRIPFTIEADPIDEVMERGRRAFYEQRRLAAENGTAGMSLDEINEEIRLARRGE